MSDSYWEELKDKSESINYLAKCLKDGTLALFLGAGTSRGFGLPDWVSLINELRKEFNLRKLSERVSAEVLQDSADEIKDLFIEKASSEEEGVQLFIEKIRHHLYSKTIKDKDYEVFDNHLLIAISALLMGSSRGHVRIVITLNFDSMLEWFLSLFGFVYKSIYKLPALEGAEDVRIYHPNGFLPHPSLNEKSSDFIIFSIDDIDDRLGADHDPWLDLIKRILHTSICLFIGMSPRTLTDRSLSPVLKTAGKKFKGQRPIGIWILKENIAKIKENEFKRKNIVPITLLEEQEISEFILKICQRSTVNFQENILIDE